MRRIERLVNLIAFLTDSGRPLTQREILEQVPGYGEGGESVRRSFERDKDTLRAMGLPLQVVPIDRLGGRDAENLGYRVVAGEPIPDPGLTTAERRALAVASALVWAEDDEGDAGGELDLGVDPSSSQLPTEAETFLHAIAERRRVTVDYRSSASDGVRSRELHPYGLTARRGRWYVTAWDSQSREVRTFRLDRVVGDPHVGGEGGFARPDDWSPHGVVPERGWAIGSGSGENVEIAVDPDWTWLVTPQSGGEPTGDVVEVGGSAWPVVSVEVRNRASFLSWVLSLMRRAVVIGPDDVRAELVERLETTIGSVSPDRRHDARSGAGQIAGGGES